MSKLILKLFITGHSAKSENAISALHAIAAHYLNNACELVVVDVLEQPQLAEDDHILATPTLIKYFPPPARRIVGDLSDMARVLRGLGIQVDQRNIELEK